MQEEFICCQNQTIIQLHAFSENVRAIKMTKTEAKMNKQFYLKISKIPMDEFQFLYIKPKYGEKAQLCYMDTDSFIIHKGVGTKFDYSNYELVKP